MTFPGTAEAVQVPQRGIAAIKSRFFATLRSAPAAAGHVILSLPRRDMSSRSPLAGGGSAFLRAAR
jgi:hypothetical protein